MKHVNLMKGIKTIFCLLTLAMNFSVVALAESEVITTIILIDREAELVDLSSDGEVLKRYVSVPDYFSSGRSHKSSLKKSLQLVKDYGYEEDYNLPGSSTKEAKELQSFMAEAMPKRTCSTTQSTLILQKTIYQQRDTQNLSQVNLLDIAGVSQQNKMLDYSKAAFEKDSFEDIFYPSVDQNHVKQQDEGPHRSTYDVIRNIYT